MPGAHDARDPWNTLRLVLRIVGILVIAAIFFALFWLRVAIVSPSMPRMTLLIGAALSLFVASAIVLYFERGSLR